MRPFPFWGSQQVFQLIIATRSTIPRSLVAVLGEINAVRVISFCFFKIHCNTNVPTLPRCLQVPLSLRSSSPEPSTHYFSLQHLRLAEPVSSFCPQNAVLSVHEKCLVKAHNINNFLYFQKTIKTLSSITRIWQAQKPRTRKQHRCQSEYVKFNTNLLQNLFHLLIFRRVSVLAVGHLQGAGEDVQHKDNRNVWRKCSLPDRKQLYCFVLERSWCQIQAGETLSSMRSVCLKVFAPYLQENIELILIPQTSPFPPDCCPLNSLFRSPNFLSSGAG